MPRMREETRIIVIFLHVKTLRWDDTQKPPGNQEHWDLSRKGAANIRVSVLINRLVPENPKTLLNLVFRFLLRFFIFLIFFLPSSNPNSTHSRPRCFDGLTNGTAFPFFHWDLKVGNAFLTYD
jgi:hypothetical protein